MESDRKSIHDNLSEFYFVEGKLNSSILNKLLKVFECKDAPTFIKLVKRVKPTVIYIETVDTRDILKEHFHFNDDLEYSSFEENYHANPLIKNVYSFIFEKILHKTVLKNFQYENLDDIYRKWRTEYKKTHELKRQELKKKYLERFEQDPVYKALSSNDSRFIYIKQELKNDREFGQYFPTDRSIKTDIIEELKVFFVKEKISK